MNEKILFVKSYALQSPPTEVLARSILENPIYDDVKYVDKKEIELAFDLYGDKLNPMNSETIPELLKSGLNIEGHFLSHNIPEISSIVIDEVCNVETLNRLLDQYDDISHIGLSVYISGMDNSIDLITEIKKNYSHLKLFVGNVGVVYPQIQNIIPQKNICFGEGVNWLRDKFNLKQLKMEEFKIPNVFGRIDFIPLPVKAAYMVTQIGCMHKCDFCITNKFHLYIPFSREKSIIEYIENLCLDNSRDVWLYLCDPNAFNPLNVWMKVFDYFIKNPKKIENNIFLCAASSLDTLSKIPLAKIQNNSPFKFLLINYGIETTVGDPYLKNILDTRKTIDLLNKLGVITFHNYIIGLPHHTSEMIDLEIQNNLKYGSDIVSISTYKPVPLTPLYQQLKNEGRVFGEDLPPELLYSEGFLPFSHKFIGAGFSILKHAFKAYFETEKVVNDIYNNIVNKLIVINSLSDSKKITRIIKKMQILSDSNFSSFQGRMPEQIVVKYKEMREETKSRLLKSNSF